MTDWDPATVDTGTARSAFVSLACAFVWLICAPAFAIASLRNRTNSDDSHEGADWGEETNHIGGK